MEKLMYEVNYHLSGDIFSHCTVSSIVVLWEGIKPGCSLPTISAIDSDGHKFSGDPNDYYVTEEQAWQAARSEISEAIKSRGKEKEKLTLEIKAMEKFLEEAY